MKSLLSFQEVSPAPIARFEPGVTVARETMFVIGGHYGPDLDATGLTCAYDPKTDTWTRYADLPVPLSHFIPVTVDDRCIWLAGGYLGTSPGRAVDTTWRFDIETDSWDQGPPLPELRASAGFALVGRKLHFFGGLGADRNTNFEDHWVLALDDDRTWRRASPMPQPRAHFGTAVVDDRIYAIGGQFKHDVSKLSHAERKGRISDVDLVHVFDPATDRWHQVQYLPGRRSHMEPGTGVYRGHIIIVGGRNNSPYALSTPMLNSPWSLPLRVLRKVQSKLSRHDRYRSAVEHVSAYDPVIDSWTELGTTPVCPLYAPGAAVIGDALIVTNGGVRGWREPTDRTFVASLGDLF